ncbi:MAG: AAC(3)-I family aminoglycoside N-acetyltransferase [Cypionkella sp.]|jgi:aminoglycoside 3-N-acetyltransferase I|nr:AAC(3)-I family aminoglycoside N-acetyltransferase [Cypionkella sp.]
MSDGTISTQRLGPSDIEALAQMNALFAEAFEDAQTYGAKPSGAGYVARILAQDHVIALVARRGATLVGGLVAYRLDKLEQDRSEIYIYDLAVAEPARRQGVATALIEAVRTIARDCGAWVIYVQADLGDDPAIALYTKLGQREDVLHFDIAP